MSVRPEQLAATLRRRSVEERAQAQTRAGELVAALDDEVRRARAEGLCGRAWLVGSLASGEFGPRSDADIVVESCSEADVGRLWDRLVGRLGVAVDLLRLEALPASFRDRVLAEGRPIGGA